MNSFSQRLFYNVFLRSSQLTGIFVLAMFLGGPRVRQEFFEMTSDLFKVSSRVEFAEWMVRSHYRMIDLTKLPNKPISVFPEEAKRFK